MNRVISILVGISISLMVFTLVNPIAITMNDYILAWGAQHRGLGQVFAAVVGFSILTTDIFIAVKAGYKAWEMTLKKFDQLSHHR